MTDLAARLALLKRPKMLVGAARRGLTHYRRDRDLPRLVKSAANTSSALLAREEELEATRAQRGAGYSAALHIAILTALLAEAALV